MILHRQGTQPRLIDSSKHSSINLNLRKRNSIYLRRSQIVAQPVIRLRVLLSPL